MTENYDWVPFYTEFADKLIGYDDKRDELFGIIKELGEGNPYFNFLSLDNDKYWSERNYHIDPFSVMAIMNRGLADKNRIKLSRIFKEKFKIVADVPSAFTGIPIVNNMRSFFDDNATGIMWEFAKTAIHFSNNEVDKQNFIDIFNVVIKRKGHGTSNLSVALFWAHPNFYFPSDKYSRGYARDKHNIMFPSYKRSGEAYYKYLTEIKEEIDTLDFPKISHLAFKEGRIEIQPPEGPDEEPSKSKCEDIFNLNINNDTNFFLLSINPKHKQLSHIDTGETISCEKLSRTSRKLRMKNSFEKIKTDDIVFGYEKHPENKIKAILRVSDVDNEAIIFEKLIQFPFHVSLEDIREHNELEDMVFLKHKTGTLFDVSREHFDILIDMIVENNCVNDTEIIDTYTSENFLNEVFMTEDKYKQLVNLLSRKKNIILQGPPGVGKTFLANRLAYSIMGQKDNNRIQYVQFHQNYTYEDFVMGYKPQGDSFQLRDGIFYKFCEVARSNPQEKHFFIIDEINRGNLSKIFGELLMAIEADYRGHKVLLPYKQIDFSVPPNLYIIGMMNTADRSLALIDYALRRRFSFININPGFESIGFRKHIDKLNSSVFEALLKQVDKINDDIKSDPTLGNGFMIGHSYFMNNESELGNIERWCEEVINYDIIPLLEEYWFDDPEKVTVHTNGLRSIINENK